MEGRYGILLIRSIGVKMKYLLYCFTDYNMLFLDGGQTMYLIVVS